MIVNIRRVASIAALILLAVGLAACGDSEADQRKAFIGFLQTRILKLQGAHVPRPSAEEQKSIGPYAEHYAVITGFNAEIDKSMQGPYKLSQTNPPRSIQEMLERRTELKAMAETMSAMAVEMRKTLAGTDAAHAALRQPDDLKRVYDAAFARVVTGPAEAFLATVPVAVDGLNTSVQLADYLDARRNTVKVIGSAIQTNDVKAKADINKMLQAMNIQNQRLNEARQHMKVVFDGK